MPARPASKIPTTHRYWMPTNRRKAPDRNQDLHTLIPVVSSPARPGGDICAELVSMRDGDNFMINIFVTKHLARLPGTYAKPKRHWRKRRTRTVPLKICGIIAVCQRCHATPHSGHRQFLGVNVNCAIELLLRRALRLAIPNQFMNLAMSKLVIKLLLILSQA